MLKCSSPPPPLTGRNDGPGGAHARQCGGALYHPVEELGPLLGLGVRPLRQRQVGYEQVIRLEAGRHVLQAGKALEHQAGPYEQQHGQRDLGGDERAAHPPDPGTAGRAACSFVQHLPQVELRGAQRRRQAENETGADRDREGEPENRRVQSDRKHRRQRIRGQPEQRSKGAPGQEQPDDGPQERQQHALGEQLADDARPAGPHGGPDGDLPAAGGRARQQQVRDVGAGDEKHEAHRPEQRPEGGPDVLHQLVLQPDHVRAHAGVVVRILLLETLRDGDHLGACLIA